MDFDSYIHTLMSNMFADKISRKRLKKEFNTSVEEQEEAFGSWMRRIYDDLMPVFGLASLDALRLICLGASGYGNWSPSQLAAQLPEALRYSKELGYEVEYQLSVRYFEGVGILTDRIGPKKHTLKRPPTTRGIADGMVKTYEVMLDMAPGDFDSTVKLFSRSGFSTFANFLVNMRKKKYGDNPPTVDQVTALELLKKVDKATRHIGDDFVWILENSKATQLGQVMEKLKNFGVIGYLLRPSAVNAAIDAVIRMLVKKNMSEIDPRALTRGHIDTLAACIQDMSRSLTRLVKSNDTQPMTSDIDDVVGNSYTLKKFLEVLEVLKEG